MIHQYAVHLHMKFKEMGWQEPKVYAHFWARLNDRPWQQIIRDDVDLSAASYPLFTVPDWIIPLNHSLPLRTYLFDEECPETLATKSSFTIIQLPPGHHTIYWKMF